MVGRGKIALMDEEVRALLQKDAIEKAPKIPGFYSRVFLVPKKDGRMRPIISLKPPQQVHHDFLNIHDICLFRNCMSVFVCHLFQNL